MDLPIENGGSFRSYVNVYQMVILVSFFFLLQSQKSPKSGAALSSHCLMAKSQFFFAHVQVFDGLIYLPIKSPLFMKLETSY